MRLRKTRMIVIIIWSAIGIALVLSINLQPVLSLSKSIISKVVTVYVFSSFVLSGWLASLSRK